MSGLWSRSITPLAPPATLDNVLGVAGNRRPVQISAIAHEGEIGVRPPEPGTGFLNLLAGKGWAAVTHDVLDGQGVL